MLYCITIKKKHDILKKIPEHAKEKEKAVEGGRREKEEREEGRRNEQMRKGERRAKTDRSTSCR